MAGSQMQLGSGAAFMAGYSGAPVELRAVSPAAHGLPGIGHMGYFRPAVAEPLWRDLDAWLSRMTG